MSTTAYRTCPPCEAMCGLAVTVGWGHDLPGTSMAVAVTVAPA